MTAHVGFKVPRPRKEAWTSTYIDLACRGLAKHLLYQR
jgi:hypothetical protein